jgi:ATP-dependent Lhr-like helicase
MLETHGALFADDLVRLTGVAADALQEALVHLAARGWVTADAADAMGAVAAWRGAARPMRRASGASMRRRWQRPDRLPPGWSGRWSLAVSVAVRGPALGAHDAAEQAARALLQRYGVVSREWWRRDCPAVSWRDGYQALVRLAFRGDAVRGWFVRGLSPVQFAHPAFADALRAPAGAGLTVVAAVDPANVRTLRLPGHVWLPHEAPRGAGAALAMHQGYVVASVESDGARWRLAPSATPSDIEAAVRALSAWVAARVARLGRSRDLVLTHVDDETPRTHAAYAAFVRAGWRPAGRTLRWPAPVGSAGL